MNEEKSESRRAVKLPPYPGLEKVHRAVRHEGFIRGMMMSIWHFTRANYEMFLKVAPRSCRRECPCCAREEIRGGKVFYDFTTRVIYDNSRVHEDNEQMQFYEEN